MTETINGVPLELLKRAVQIPSKASVEENHAAIVDRGRAQAELRDMLNASPVSEAKAQVYEPLVCDYCNAETQDPWHGSGMLNGVESRHIHACSQCRNLLPTTKAQGVVMPERWNVQRPMWKDARQPYGNPLNHADIEAAEKFNLALDEVARLNAAPVQQVSVPASAFASRAITHYEAALLAAFPSGSSGEVLNQWNEARRVLAAAPAAPAADAGLEADRDSHQRCAIQAMAELAAIKAQEPVAWLDTDGELYAANVLSGLGIKTNKLTPLYAAPVSEAKAQRVAVPAELDRAFITGESCDGVYRVVIQSETMKEMQAVHSWLARLNAAPVQQVSVPDGFVLAKETVVEMPDGSKELGYTTIGRVGIFNSAEEVFDAIRELDLPLGWVSMTTEQLLPGWMLAASPAAPAADASDVLEQAMYTLISIGYHENSGLVHELRQALAAHSAEGVV